MIKLYDKFNDNSMLQIGACSYKSRQTLLRHIEYFGLPTLIKITKIKKESTSIFTDNKIFNSQR